MNKTNLSELTFTELKALYPELTARSKSGLLEQIADAQLVSYFEVVVPDNTTEFLEKEEIVDVVSDDKTTEFDDKSETYTWYNILNYIKSVSKSSKKILIECPTTMEADLIWSRCKDELFPVLNKEEISLMASSTRRDMHLNGTCYLRFVCHTNFAHLKSIFRYDTFKKLV